MADKWDFAAHNVACNIPGDVSAAGETMIAAALRTAVAEEHTRTAQQAFDIALELMDSISIEYDEKEWHELAARYREYREIVALFDEHVAYNEAQDARIAAIRARTQEGKP